MKGVASLSSHALFNKISVSIIIPRIVCGRDTVVVVLVCDRLIWFNGLFCSHFDVLLLFHNSWLTIVLSLLILLCCLWEREPVQEYVCQCIYFFWRNSINSCCIQQHVASCELQQKLIAFRQNGHHQHEQMNCASMLTDIQ